MASPLPSHRSSVLIALDFGARGRVERITRLFIVSSTFNSLTLGGKIMKRLMMVALITSILIVVSGFAGSASAGVEPSPFRSAFGKLGSIDNNLAEVQRNLNLVLAEPPLDDQTPGWKGDANRLRGLANHMAVIDSRLVEILDAQDPGMSLLELYDYLEETILYRADSIEFEMQEFIRIHNDKLDRMPKLFVGSFFDVLDIVQEMQERIFEFINPPPSHMR
jgi:hypothetical protein